MQLNLSIDIAPMKVAANKHIDVSAESIRESVITLGAGQAMAYDQKRAEAEAYLASYRDDGMGFVEFELGQWDVPHIYSEAAVEGVSRFDMARAIVTSAFEWTVLSSRIEALRIGHKRQVTAARTPAEIEAAKAVDWSAIYV